MAEKCNDVTVIFHDCMEVHAISGDVHAPICMHSCAKPIQILPLLEDKLDVKYGLTAKEISFMVSSHLAQQEHMDAFLSILEKTGLKESDMILTESVPHGKLSRTLWRTGDGRLRKRYHPCSGNHLAMMLIQRELTSDVSGYEKEDSAVQQRIMDRVRWLADLQTRDLLVSTDGCGIPAFTLPAYRIARIYQNLGVLAQTEPSVCRLIDAVHQHPRMIEGDQCIATVLNSQPGMFAKTGIGGLLTLSLLECQVGLIIKTSNGWETVCSALKVFLQKSKMLTPELRSEINDCFR